MPQERAIRVVFNLQGSCRTYQKQRSKPMKTYLKDLTPDEVIRRLKAGEVLKCEERVVTKLVEGMLCTYYADDNIRLNSSIYIDDFAKENLYFETPDELKLEVSKRYKTKDGRMAFISLEVGEFFSGVVEGDNSILVWNKKGEYSDRVIGDNLDLISEWSDDDVAED